MTFSLFCYWISVFDFDEKLAMAFHISHPLVLFIHEVIWHVPLQSWLFLSWDGHALNCLSSVFYYLVVLSSVSFSILLVKGFYYSSTMELASLTLLGLFCSYMQKLGMVNLRWLWGIVLALTLLTTWFSPVRLLRLLQGNVDYWQLSCQSRCQITLIVLLTTRNRILDGSPLLKISRGSWSMMFWHAVKGVIVVYISYSAVIY